jgi:16S rRNA (adenine1518-N6/adenine1519-N6)-dimethyltransferase
MSKHRPRKRFGQHFLTDPGIIDDIVNAIAPDSDDIVVEIGPGLGAITSPLAARAGRLHAIELDRDLAAKLRSRFGNESHVTIHEADALTFDFAALGNSLRIVGNLPYNISTPLLFRLLELRDSIHDMHFMLQKEVVARMAASPGSKAYGRLSIMLGCYLDIEALFTVDRLAFEPPPEVMSALVRLRPLPEGYYEVDDHALLGRIVAAAFSKRRKTLRNALKNVVDAADLAAVGIDTSLRPEQIPISDYVTLSNHIARRESNGLQ